MYSMARGAREERRAGLLRLWHFRRAPVDALTVTTTTFSIAEVAPMARLFFLALIFLLWTVLRDVVSCCGRF
jgi:hypothetical protein